MTDQSRRIQAVLFDWAGTTIDHGSLAPMRVFVELFRRRGIEIEVSEARGPMGRSKHDHIAEVARLPRIAACWRELHGREPTDADVREMYQEFLPLQKQLLAQGCDLIGGVIETVAALRSRGIKIGSTTGYTRELMSVVTPLAAKHGYIPDILVSSDDVRAGRPAPWLNLRAVEQLGIYPLSSVIVVDDTPVGIQAGINSGMWTVGVARTGNEFGLSLAETEALGPVEYHDRLHESRSRLLNAGAHYVIEGVANLMPIVDAIERQIEAGERP